MVDPITPNDVDKNSIKPDEVIEAFNELIQKYWDGKRAKFKQNEVIDLISQKMNIVIEDVFTYHYLDINHIYERVGWKVYYDKPGYFESYMPTFEFTKIE